MPSRASTVNVAPVIELVDVRKVHRQGASEVVSVDGVSLVVPAGTTLCLIGTSGSGKTTTLRMINRLVEPTSGSVRIDGRDVNERDPIALRRGIGYVTQRGGLFPHLTVAQNVGLLLRLEGWSEARVGERVQELLERVALSGLGGRYPRELSGGQRQRVGVARALALDPPHLLMDEPFGALDPITRRELQGELARLWKKLEKTVIVVTHDLAEAFALGDRVALMRAGKIVQEGTEADFRERPADAFVAEFVAAS